MRFQYTWYLAGQANPLASGVVAVVVLPVGTNSITLVVNDGRTSRQQTIAVEVITIIQAVERLPAVVNTDVAKEQGDGTFHFDDPVSSQIPGRFCRVVTL
jgi:hypothetical protein